MMMKAFTFLDNLICWGRLFGHHFLCYWLIKSRIHKVPLFLFFSFSSGGRETHYKKEKEKENEGMALITQSQRNNKPSIDR